jgi:hypothetical protein
LASRGVAGESFRDDFVTPLAILTARFGLDSTLGRGQLRGGCPLADLRRKWNFQKKGYKIQMVTTSVRSQLRVICATPF